MSSVAIKGYKRRLTVTIEFGGQPYRNENDGYFSIRGQIGGGNRWIEYGGCVKHIREICNSKWHSLLDELLKLKEKHSLKYCRCIPKKDADRIVEIINADKL